MDNINATDDDLQTSSNDSNSSDDISSVSTETLLPVDENDQRQISSMSNIHVCPVNVNDHNNIANLNIKHPYQSNNSENGDPFNDEKRIIIDEHVKVSHINRSNLERLNTEILLSRLSEKSRRKSTSNVTVFRANKKLSQSVNGNLNNQQITPMTSRQSTVRISHISTAAHINQGSDQKIIASKKPLVTRVSVSNEQPRKTKPKELHVSVKHISVNSEKSS